MLEGLLYLALLLLLLLLVLFLILLFIFLFLLCASRLSTCQSKVDGTVGFLVGLQGMAARLVCKGLVQAKLGGRLSPPARGLHRIPYMSQSRL